MGTATALLALVVIAVAGAACADQWGDSRMTVDDFPIVTCSMHYRVSLSAGFERNEDIELRPDDERTVAFSDVEFAMKYLFSVSEGATFLIDAKAPGGSDFFARGLYQFTEKLPTGSLFAGGHGFTGLHYVHPPGSSSEAQYFCRATKAS